MKFSLEERGGGRDDDLEKTRYRSKRREKESEGRNTRDTAALALVKQSLSKKKKDRRIDAHAQRAGDRRPCDAATYWYHTARHVWRTIPGCSKRAMCF